MNEAVAIMTGAAEPDYQEALDEVKRPLGPTTKAPTT